MTTLRSLTCVLSFLLCCGTIAPAQEISSPTLDSARQLMVVTTPGWNSVDGRLQRFERAKPRKHWKKVGKPIDIVVGRNGLGWAQTSSSAVLANPVDPNAPVKKEGDGRSPAGVFPLTSSFGYAAQPQPGLKLPYIALTPTVECVDDTASSFYNRIVDRATVTPDWHSSEHMASAGEAYRWGAVIDFNPSGLRGAGSCVFLHIWAGQGVGTSGCTAMPENQLIDILVWLDPSRKPVIVELPRDQYKKIRKHLHLPKPPKA